MGFGASGTVLFVASGLWRKLRYRLLAVSALLFTLAALGSYWAIGRIPFDAYRLVLEPVMFLHMANFYLAQVVPFFFAGLALGGAIALEPRKAGGLYGASLVGSGFGSLLALGGPAALGPSGALGTVAALGAVAWIAFIPKPSARRLLLPAGIAVALVAGGWLLPREVELQMSPYKALPQVLRQRGAERVWSGWSAFSRADVVNSDALHQAPGLSFAYSGGLPVQTALTLDGDNLTGLTATTPEEAAFTEYLPTALPYHLVDAPRVLVVEPGGGLDVLTALHHGATDVVALVGNPLEAALLRDRFRDAAGQVFSDPRVRLVAGNPRGYLAREDERFDVVVVSLRDTFRPVTSGAYSLLESHVYTIQAFQQYLRHLSPGGFLVVTRWVQTPPSEELRVAATVVEALERQGIESGRDRVAAIRTLQTLTLLAKTEPFTATEARVVREFAESRRMDLSYLPGLEIEDTNRFFVLPREVYYSGLKMLLDPKTRGRFYDEQTFDVVPATDDRPFFFHFFRWTQVPDVIGRLGRQWQPFGGAGFLVVLAFLAVSAVVSAAFILGPLLAQRAWGGRLEERDGFSSWRVLGYFFTLGLAFLWLELPLMQQFILLLTHPIYSFGVVLFGVLVFSGVGSILSPRLGAYRGWAILVLGVLAMVYAVGTGPMVQLMLGLPLAARIIVAALAIAPLALLMGVPFPTGISVLEAQRPRLVPWAWGANGFASVLGSVLAALMALTWGFSSVMLAAGVGYLVAWAVLYPVLKARFPPPGAQSGPPLD